MRSFTGLLVLFRPLPTAAAAVGRRVQAQLERSRLAQPDQHDAAGAHALACKNKAPAPKDGYQNSLRVLYSQNREAGNVPRKYSRHIPQAPERILDAPELLDDYYLNLLDWSSTNVLGVALGDSIYLWNATDGSIQQLMQTQGENSHVTSLSWIQQLLTHGRERRRRR